MSRYLKERIVEEYAERFRGVADVAVIGTEGIDANRMVAFRDALRERGIRAMRVRNRLYRLAVRGTPLEGVEALLTGPSTVVWGGDSIVDVAKALTEQAKELQQLEIRGGVSGGAVLTKDEFEALSKLPSRTELIGQVIARAVGQAGRVVALATGVAAGLVAQIREIEKKAPDGAAAEAPAEGESPAGPSGGAEAEGKADSSEAGGAAQAPAVETSAETDAPAAEGEPAASSDAS